MGRSSGKRWADMSRLERAAIIAITAVTVTVGSVIFWIILGVLMLLGQFVWEGVHL